MGNVAMVGGINFQPQSKSMTELLTLTASRSGFYRVGKYTMDVLSVKNFFDVS